jgi:hypothetical protein
MKKFVFLRIFFYLNYFNEQCDEIKNQMWKHLLKKTSCDEIKTPAAISMFLALLISGTSL